MSKLEITMMRRGLALVPYGSFAEDEMDKIRTTKPVLVTVTQPRNPDHHRKFYALAAKVADFDKDFLNAEDAVRWVKRRIPGMHKRYRDEDGNLVIELESLSFASMDQLSFDSFYNRALDLWAQKIGCDPENLLAQSIS